MRVSWGQQVAPIMGALLTVVMVAGLVYAVATMPAQATGLADVAVGDLDRVGASNPVTAVLLNYRSYDTLLEITVLLLAALAARALVGEWFGGVKRASERQNPVLRGFVRVVVPVMMLVAGYLLWVGGHAPGGAFQAGAVLASAGVLLFLGGVDWSRKLPPWAERFLLAVGLVTFLAVGVGVMTVTGGFLEYPPKSAKWLILVIEAPCGLSIAGALIALFLGGRLRTRPALTEEWT